jgi:hypothetical protein
VGELAKREELTPDPTLGSLAEKANALHRSGQAKASGAVEDFIGCGEVLLEAKAKAPKGKWLVWLDTHFVGSRRHAQRYMELAKNRDLLSNDATRVSHYSLRAAMRELRDAKASEKRQERQQRQDEHARRWDEQLQRILAGEVKLPMEMQTSHTYDFENLPEDVACAGLWEDEPLLCLVEERVGVASFHPGPDWQDDARLWPLYQAFFLDESDEDEEFLRLLTQHGISPRSLDSVDLKVSSELYDEEGNYRPPLRPLSWDGSTLLLPTGHVEARRVGETIWAWWEWDQVDGAQILKLADPNLVRRVDLEEVLEHCERSYARGAWMDAREAEALLAHCLSGVRAGLERTPPDLKDPKVLYELGEHILDSWEVHSGDWQRFGAYVASLNRS